MSDYETFLLDGRPVRFERGQTILEAALAAGHYIPNLCHHPEFKPHGSCKLCTIKVNGRYGSACTVKAMPGQEVSSDTPELNGNRRVLLQMLFVEGSHFCPGCEKSGNCALQALAYDLEMLTPHYAHFYPSRPLDASHPDVLIDFNRCIMCELCVRASREVDGKNVFALAGRGVASHVVVNSPSGKLADTDFALTDKAAHICPVGAILPKRVGFAVPIGSRTYDVDAISTLAERRATEEA
ncbi:2Fe-2S iron-sulfur cluster-binding protein [Pinisolibacter aquiterrae]|uniref:2Fe-2S iron-sulfur cluster-binding protein n=1 Tax=Pinisolibacter aquiterrae TaxID=2815579 RepID=UPI001C3DC0B1|nr:2Fe-2S iron-sulfur cluster-binding protein [Pinisolibacter aquiterrae]MBV5265617.1 (2Fe-2S)-binding protein [Pinisolibacter aquiterrae]MCC8236818.1 2Fe-2S iron-sulfur cluster-binding protein [Pinisolibacter aquiterrae]